MKNDVNILVSKIALNPEKAGFRKANAWTLDLVAQYPELAGLKRECQICGNTRNLRLRCIGGFVSEPMTIAICGDCSQVLGDRRTAWNRTFHGHPLLTAPCEAYAVYDLVNVLLLKAKKTEDNNYRILAHRLAMQFKKGTI